MIESEITKKEMEWLNETPSLPFVEPGMAVSKRKLRELLDNRNDLQYAIETLKILAQDQSKIEELNEHALRKIILMDINDAKSALINLGVIK